MPYTLVMGLVWFVLAFLLGIVVGGLLRSIVARRQIARARSAEGVDAVRRAAEVEIAALTAERDAIRAELAERSAAAAAAAAAPPVAAPEEAATAAPAPVSEPAASDAVADPVTGPVTDPASDAVGDGTIDDDLTVVVGIDAAVAELCQRIGIRTYAELATTETSLLRTMLADAGGPVADRDPDTWPAQARLLADGRWDEFEVLTAGLAGDPGSA